MPSLPDLIVTHLVRSAIWTIFHSSLLSYAMFKVQQTHSRCSLSTPSTFHCGRFLQTQVDDPDLAHIQSDSWNKSHSLSPMECLLLMCDVSTGTQQPYTISFPSPHFQFVVLNVTPWHTCDSTLGYYNLA